LTAVKAALNGIVIADGQSSGRPLIDNPEERHPSHHASGGNMRSDEEIKRDVEDELRWDPNVHADDIAVAVKDGVVTLTGFVTTYAQKLAAERVVKRVAGVVGVANDIEVRFSGVDQRPDPDIARDVIAELKIWLPQSWENIKAVVKDGWVTLEGEVEWNYQRQYAENAIPLDQGGQGRQQFDPPEAEDRAIAGGN
jgi:osmotically-inducible protein OsmY